MGFDYDHKIGCCIFTNKMFTRLHRRTRRLDTNRGGQIFCTWTLGGHGCVPVNGQELLPAVDNDVPEFQL